ncbi:hypothetical protein O6P43_005129 [Quillaja saponaria]|uniref:Uncharacterized protein n=1 Tax=Quillaja saponaria TaxID=32244 RepID=A0AAD7Q5B0_QUISA|nr:hypothetical protein O6P43_005129 [Quillaja saponaria]
METGDLVPVCGLSMQRYRKRGRYHRILKTVVNDNDHVNISLLEEQHAKFQKVGLIPRVQPKIRLSMNLLKRFRDAYVGSMLCFADHVPCLNNVYFEMKIQDDQCVLRSFS